MPQMLFLLTEATQEANPLTLMFPMNPETVTVTHSTKTVSFNILETGSIVFPRGDDPYQVSWSGILPGPSRFMAPFLTGELQDVYSFITQLHLWQALGTKLNIQVTDAPINMTGFISQLDHTVGGGHGDITYNITFLQWREVIIGVDPSTSAAAAASALTGGSGADAGSSLLSSSEEGDDGTTIEYPPDVPPYTPPDTQGSGDTRSEANRPGSHLVQPGDTLIGIALRYYNDDTVWRRIWEENRTPNGPIGDNYNDIDVGWTLRLP